MADRAQKIARGFDRLSIVYDGIVRIVFGDRLNVLQQKTIRAVGPAKNILMVGGGSGVLLPFILAETGAEQLHFAELSSKMRQKAAARLSSIELEKTRFLSDWKNATDQPFDLILLPFVLDCYQSGSIASMLASYKELLSENGTMIITDFSAEKAAGYEAHWLKSTFIRLLYTFFRATTSIEASSLAPFDTLAAEAGFKRLEKQSIIGGWVQSTHWTVPRKDQSTA